MEELVFNKERDVLLNVFAPWCGHCKNFSPEYRKVARKIHLLGMDHKILVATMDGTANESASPEIFWDGFPTIVLVKAGTREPIHFTAGNRQATKLYKWLVNHSTHREGMDKELGDVSKNDL